MSEVIHQSKLYPFRKFRIFRKKEGICFICQEEVYYGIGIENDGGTNKVLCKRCAKIIAYIRLSKWCI